MDDALRSLSGAGGPGLLHYAAEIEEEDGSHVLQMKMTELLFRHIHALPKESQGNLLWKSDSTGATPAHWAGHSGAIFLLKALLDDNNAQVDGSAIDMADEKNETALFWASLAGRYEVGQPPFRF